MFAPIFLCFRKAIVSVGGGEQGVPQLSFVSLWMVVLSSHPLRVTVTPPRAYILNCLVMLCCGENGESKDFQQKGNLGTGCFISNPRFIFTRKKKTQ